MNYSRLYQKLMIAAQLRNRPTGYCERHHIVPKSLGGLNNKENLVFLTPKEHFVAHHLLWKIHRNKQMARAFTLLSRNLNKVTSKDYENAKLLYASSMRGDNNPAKLPDVKAKITKNHSRFYLNKCRPEHSEFLKSIKKWAKESNPFFGTGERQRGAKNKMARAVIGLHVFYGVRRWGTATDAAKDLKVTIQAVAGAIKRNGRSNGWRLEYVR